MRAMRHRLELYSARIGSPDLALSILPLRSASACFLGLDPGGRSVGGLDGRAAVQTTPAFEALGTAAMDEAEVFLDADEAHVAVSCHA